MARAGRAPSGVRDAADGHVWGSVIRVEQGARGVPGRGSEGQGSR